MRLRCGRVAGLFATVLAASATVATAQTDEADTNPCHDPALALRCPDLRMAPPTDLRVQRAGSRLRLLATNRIVNVGTGALELRGGTTRDHGRATYAKATQIIRGRDGRPYYFPEAGWIYWKAIPGQGHYWKFYGAARFELWTLKPDGTRDQMQRTGPKLSYCFRDLRRVRASARARAVYPACSQELERPEFRLGVSPGWADIYPSTYPQNWISITGLKGCFAFVHRADPTGQLIEQREDDNLGERIIRLPPRQGSVAPRGCPDPR